MSTIAFRRWRVSAGGKLVGLGVPYVWVPGAQTAQCRGIDGLGLGNCAPGRVRPGHAVPAMRSRCGIWAHSLPIAGCGCEESTSERHGAVGAVRLWGRYIEHENGFRAEHARVVALVDYTGRVLPSYDAPRYPDLDSMYGEWAPDVTARAPGEATVWCRTTAGLPGSGAFLQGAARVGADLQRALERVAAAFQAEVGPLLNRLRDDVGRPRADQ